MRMRSVLLAYVCLQLWWLWSTYIPLPSSSSYQACTPTTYYYPKYYYHLFKNSDTFYPTEKDEPKTSSVASVFPWLPLSSSDRQILSATNSRLQSHSIILVARSSEFLCDVLFKDFPPEIFLQRPAIVQVKCFQLINGNDAEMSHPKLCWYVICPIFTVFQFPHDSYL